MSKGVHVITCNDSVEYVVVGPLDIAKDKMQELINVDYAMNRGVWEDRAKTLWKDTKTGLEIYTMQQHWMINDLTNKSSIWEKPSG